MEPDIKGKIVELSKKEEGEIIELRRDFHRYPELGFAEKRTAERAALEMESLGLSVQTGIAGTGVVGLLRGTREGPTILLRADMDALPITDKKNVSYASRVEGVMHACGHDAHTAILIGTARVLSQLRDHLRGNVKFLFQPAEEGPGGAAPMIEQGVLENPRVDAALGLHVDPDFRPGQIGVGSGPINANTDEVNLTIFGEGGHGARPQTGVDALTVTAQAILAMQQIVSRMVDPQQDLVLTFGTIAGGYRRNIIPDRVCLEGTMRTRTDELRAKMPLLLHQVLQGITSSFGASYSLEVDPHYPALINNSGMVKVLEEALQEMGSVFEVIKDIKPSMGGEDFAFFSRKVPAVFFRLGTGSDQRTTGSAHNSLFDIDERPIAMGMQALALTVFKFLEGELDVQSRINNEQSGGDLQAGE